MGVGGGTFGAPAALSGRRLPDLRLRPELRLFQHRAAESENYGSTTANRSIGWRRLLLHCACADQHWVNAELYANLRHLSHGFAGQVRNRYARAFCQLHSGRSGGNRQHRGGDRLGLGRIAQSG